MCTQLLKEEDHVDSSRMYVGGVLHLYLDKRRQTLTNPERGQEPDRYVSPSSYLTLHDLS